MATAEAYLRAKWHLDPSSHLATIDMGQKVGTAVPLLGAAELGPQSDRMSPGPRPPISVASGIMIHPAMYVCMYVLYVYILPARVQRSSLLSTHMLRPFYSRPIALTQEGRSLVNDVCECVRD